MEGFKARLRDSRTCDPADDDFETPDVGVKFTGPDVDLLLANRAELLLALEHVTMEALRMPSDDHSRISFDANDYRLLRIEELRLSAMAAADKVKRTGVPFRFNPMNSRERRVIHLALRNETAVRSESLGSGPAARRGGLPGRHGQPARAAAFRRAAPAQRAPLARRRPTAAGNADDPKPPDRRPRRPRRTARYLNFFATPSPPSPLRRGAAGWASCASPARPRAPSPKPCCAFRPAPPGAPGARAWPNCRIARATRWTRPSCSSSKSRAPIPEKTSSRSPATARPWCCATPLERAVEAGARLAEPGEFTLRAYLNGRLDLPRAEAVRDLIEATTLYQARVAARQAGGSVSRRIAPLKERLLELIALLEAGIDFAEDDVSVARRRRDPRAPRAGARRHRQAGRQLPVRRPGDGRPDAGHRRPAERGQEQPF